MAGGPTRTGGGDGLGAVSGPPPSRQLHSREEPGPERAWTSFCLPPYSLADFGSVSELSEPLCFLIY